MSTSQRVSRGFHRLAVFLAVIPLLVGAIIVIDGGKDAVVSAGKKYKTIECANAVHQKDSRQFFRSYFEASNVAAFLRELGCSDGEYVNVTFEELGKPPDFDWLSILVSILTVMGITGAVSLGVYSLIRGIGWVIGGFAAS
jgi:hypothetical protein